MSDAREALIESFPMSHPGDVAGLRAALAGARYAPSDIVCIQIKCEGNGLDNDHSRVLAHEATARALAEAGADEAAIRAASIVPSGGCEGVITPHMTVFARRRAAPGPDGPGVARLAIGRAASAPLAAEQIGTRAQVEAVAEAVRAAAGKGKLALDEVVYVQVKTAFPSDAELAQARARGARPRRGSASAMKPLARGAAGLGVAVALGELDLAAIDDGAIGEDVSLYGTRGCATAGALGLRMEAIAFGNSAHWSGRLRVASGCLRDALDLAAVDGVLAALGLRGTPQLDAASRSRVRAVVYKGDPPRSGLLRGERAVMWQDSDVHALRQMRAAIGGVLAARLGSTRLYVGCGAEHQAPDGGGTIAIFAETA